MSEFDRGKALKRVLHLIRLLETATRQYTLLELADRLSVTTRTIRRDLAILEEVGAIVEFDREAHAPYRAVVCHLVWKLELPTRRSA